MPVRSSRPRAVTLIEVMVVIAIAGMLAMMAVPSFQDMAVSYRAQEDARAVLMHMTRARALAQRENVPVKLVIGPTSVSYQRAEFGTLTPEQLASSVRRNVTGFGEVDSKVLPRAATVTSVQFVNNGAVVSSATPGTDAASIIFCASSDTYFRHASGGAPVCNIGDLTSASARIQFNVLNKPFHVRVNGALGSVDLKRGAQ